ncbi:MAG: hypothetical protein JWQ03_2633 [Variovorax sp.]|nr:hypothetical protein [Variovorax sp.]
MHWDIFCKVIDNHGDLGVCWRLACGLATAGEEVRLWVDDASALSWMAPAGQGGVAVVHWNTDSAASEADGAAAPDVLIEAFGCDPAPELIARFAEAARASGRKRPWINLEYLSAEPWVERLHGLPSPVSAGPGAGLVKHFFYPGFSERTGGLLRETGLAGQRQRFDRAAWLRAQGIAWRGETVLALFCYEPPALPALLARLAEGPAPTRLLVAAGRPTRAVQAGLPDAGGDFGGAGDCGALRISYLPAVPQAEFDHLLWSADLNFVRGEDSLVRALWAGVPFVWQIYPQDDGAHHAKLEAFLDWLQAPPSLRRFHRLWNGIGTGALPALDAETLADWGVAVRSARHRLYVQDDLITQLRRFVGQKS